MKRKVLIPILMLGMAMLSPLGAVEIRLDGCRTTRSWNTFNGAEFPGAQVRLTSDPEGLQLEYDFSEGGAYVGVELRNAAIPEAESVTLTLRADRAAAFNYRVIDATGRFFQGRGVTLPGGKTETLALSLSGPWGSMWGGEGEHSQPRFPLRSLWLMATRADGLPPAGTLTLQALTMQTAALPAESLNGGDFEQTLAGWSLKGEWQPQLSGAMLKLTATPTPAAESSLLELAAPQAGRDLTERHNLTPGKPLVLFYKMPFPHGVNPRNRYRLTLRVTSGPGQQAEYSAWVAGPQASEVNFGDPRASRELAGSRFGTCVHFSYAPRPEGAFHGWYPKELILDEIAACGFHYIREGLALDRTSDGGWKVRDVDLETLRKAHERGIEQIVEIGMSAEDSIEEFLRKIEAVVRDSREYVNIYELGNEPNNFGGWRQKYKFNGRDGSWNGYEADGSISEWVKAHVRHTNAGADYLKKIAPEKTVIGLGSCVPTNFHALNLGVSDNLDGVVEHPYTFSLTPEKVPFGLSLTERDGIAVGDADHTFAGLVESYHEQFRKTGRARSLWITEFGFTTYWFGREKKMYGGFTEEAQALYLLRRFIESLALPVEAVIQYDFVDDYNSDVNTDEANFGLLRADYSRKPAFYVMQRMNALLAGAERDDSLSVTVTDDTLHRSAVRAELVRDWDNSRIQAANGIRAYAFSHPDTPDEKLLAVWSMQPYSREFNNRVISFEVEGLGEFHAPPVVIDMISGASFDFPVNFAGGKATVIDLPLKDNVLLFKFFR